jgi:hypothetical protein
VIIETTDHEPEAFGSLEDDAHMRFCRSLMSQSPNLTIEVGYRHMENKKRIALHKSSLYLDFDVANEVELIIKTDLPGRIRAILRRASVGVSPLNSDHLILHYDINLKRPAHAYGQAEDFPAGSEQARFFEQRPQWYTIICQCTLELLYIPSASRHRR